MPGPDHARAFELFISYSHRSEAVKDRLLTNLRVLERLGLVSTWTDRAIPPGAAWRAEIEAAIERADAALFVVCADFLASGFCMDVELAAFLRRRWEEGVLILFAVTQEPGSQMARGFLTPRRQARQGFLASLGG